MSFGSILGFVAGILGPISMAAACVGILCGGVTLDS